MTNQTDQQIIDEYRQLASDMSQLTTKYYGAKEAARIAGNQLSNFICDNVTVLLHYVLSHPETTMREVANVTHPALYFASPYIDELLIAQPVTGLYLNIPPTTLTVGESVNDSVVIKAALTSEAPSTQAELSVSVDPERINSYPFGEQYRRLKLFLTKYHLNFETPNLEDMNTSLYDNGKIFEQGDLEVKIQHLDELIKPHRWQSAVYDIFSTMRQIIIDQHNQLQTK